MPAQRRRKPAGSITARRRSPARRPRAAISAATDVEQSAERQLAGGSGRRCRPATATAPTRCRRRDRGVDLHARQQQRRRCRRSMSASALTDSFTATVTDDFGATATATRHHHHSPRTNDAAVISGTTTGNVTGCRRGQSKPARQASRPRHGDLRHADRDRQSQLERQSARR